MGTFTLVDPFMTYDASNFYSTGSTTCYPTKSLWQIQTFYDCYISHQNQPANTYVILKWPLVNPTYGTIGDFDTSANAHYDQFFVYEGIN